MIDSFANNTDPIIDELLIKCQTSLEAHCKIFHPDRFDRPFSHGHKKLFELIDDRSIQKILVLAHRGFGKTSLFNFGLPSQAIVGELAKFIVPVSCSSSSAIMQSENLKQELLANTAIKTVIGNIKSDSFSKESWITRSGIHVLPRGAGQQTRGILYGDLRPELIIVDDLENSEGVLSQEQRIKTKEWFFSDLSNSIDRAKKNWRIVVVGTLLHEAALLQDLREDPSWTVLDLPLCDFTTTKDSKKTIFNSLWPEFMNNTEVDKLVEDYEHQGLAEVFWREYMNIANPRTDAVFRPEFFKYYDEKDLVGNTNLETVILVDPAKTAKQHSAFTAIVGVAVDTTENAIYVRDIVNSRLEPDQIYTKAFDMAERLGSMTIGVETTGIEEWIKQPFENEMLRRGKTFQLEWLTARSGQLEASSAGGIAKGATKGKTRRVAALASFYRMGQIFHNKSCCGVLEEQLLAFPRPKYWDVMDAFAYIIQMLSIGQRFFEHKSDPTLVAKHLLADQCELNDEDRELELMAEQDRLDDLLMGTPAYG